MKNSNVYDDLIKYLNENKQNLRKSQIKELLKYSKQLKQDINIEENELTKKDLKKEIYDLVNYINNGNKTQINKKRIEYLLYLYNDLEKIKENNNDLKLNDVDNILLKLNDIYYEMDLPMKNKKILLKKIMNNKDYNEK